jgi:hypothetical protein
MAELAVTVLGVAGFLGFLLAARMSVLASTSGRKPKHKDQCDVFPTSCPLVASGARRIAQLGMQFKLWKPSMQ